MNLLIAGLALFFIPHLVSVVSPPWRDRMVQRIGLLTWKGLYSVVSLAGLLLIVKGYSEARMAPVILYTPPTGMRHLAALLMLPVFPLLLATYLPGRIQSLSRHPMLVATKLWALAHLLANGRAEDLLLFGSFLIWAVLVRISYARRDTRTVPGAPPTAYNDLIAIVGGLGLYGLFALKLHAILIGLPPF